MVKRQFVVCGLVGLMLLGMVGCSSEEESAMKGFISAMNDLADRLGKIKSQADYDSAKDDLKKINTRLEEQASAMSKLEKATEEEQKKLRDKYEPEFEKAMTRVFNEMQRLAGLGIDIDFNMGRSGKGMGF